MLLIACKKDNYRKNTNAAKLYNISFNVNNFSSQKSGYQLNSMKSTGLTANTATYDTLMTPEILYIVYDSTGKEVHHLTQISSDAAFGQINDQLATGTYTVVFVGAENMLNSFEGNRGLYFFPTKSLQTDIIYYYFGFASEHFDETFFKKITLNVTGGNVNQNVDMTRIVGQLAVNIKDAIPSNATEIAVQMSGVNYHFSLGTGLPSGGKAPIQNLYYPVGSSPSQGYTPFVTGATNYTMYAYILNEDPFNVTITCYNGNSILASKTISNVRCTANKQTVLTGNLFGGAGSSTGGSINIGVDTTWNSSLLTYSF